MCITDEYVMCSSVALSAFLIVIPTLHPVMLSPFKSLSKEQILSRGEMEAPIFGKERNGQPHGFTARKKERSQNMIRLNQWHGTVLISL